MSQTGYNSYEIGKSEPNIDTLKKLSRYYNEPIDYMVDNELGYYVDGRDYLVKQLAGLKVENERLKGETKVGEFWHLAYKEKQAEYDLLLYDFNQLNQQLKEKDAEIERLKTTNKRLYDKKEKLIKEQSKKNIKWYNKGVQDNTKQVWEKIEMLFKWNKKK